MKFSLIIATKGRCSEVGHLLESIKLSFLSFSDYEVIIVDQNQSGYLQPVIDRFLDMPIVHIVSDVSGLSLNRNIGIEIASGDVFCFPDDDCLFYHDTISAVHKMMESPEVNVCMGRIFDREKNKNVFKKWPQKPIKVNKFNSYFINSSITLFSKKEFVVSFDENLGVGARYGSCEDADFIHRVVASGANVFYTPTIEVWHPEPNYNDISLEKVKSYASGFGYFIRKDTDSTKLFLLTLLIFKKILQFSFNIFTRKFKRNYFKSFFSGLIDGLMRKRPM